MKNRGIKFFNPTPYGFEWGNAVVTRTCSDKNSVYMSVTNQQGTECIHIRVDGRGRILVSDIHEPNGVISCRFGKKKGGCNDII